MKTLFTLCVMKGTPQFFATVLHAVTAKAEEASMNFYAVAMPAAWPLRLKFAARTHRKRFLPKTRPR